MVYRLFPFLFLLLPSLLFAQLEDDFSDGDISANPSWQGDVSSFIVNTDAQLQLSAPAAGTALIYTPFVLPDSLEWNIYTLMDFAPSSSNLLRLYLQADAADLLNAKGYYLEVGESGNTDAIRIYRQDGGGMPDVLLASGAVGQMGNDPATARIRITRNALGNWTLEADYTGGNNFQTETTFSDATYGSGNSFFGIYCKFTSSRIENFFFDDLNIRTITPDTIAPQLTSLQVIDDTSIDLTFNEPLDPSSVSNAAFYEISNGIGQPASASLDLSTPTLIHLDLATALQNGQDYTLATNQIRDLAGNISGSQQLSFSFFQTSEAALYDVLITEIMADPSPEIGLPAVEYFEIFNASDKFIELSSLQFIRGGNQAFPFPSQIISPGEYMIVCDESEVPLFTPFGKTAAISGFPSLTNSGDLIQIESSTGTLIHLVDYSIDWYQDNEKDEGGWSLELLSLQQLCASMDNWRASVDPSGGTPGRENSIFEDLADINGPRLNRVFPVSENQLRLYFDESLDPLTSANAIHYDLSGLTISNISVEAPLYTTVLIETVEDFEIGEIYTVSVEGSLTDCLGNMTQATQNTSFGLPEELEEGDLILNEILYYPAVGGDRFIELYNRSQKTANVGELLVASRDEMEQIENIKVVPTDYLLFPGEYVVFSTSATDINTRYTVERPQAIIEMSLPSYDSKADEVLIYTTGSNGTTIIDELRYTADFHNPLLDNERGVSIERINPNADTQSENNWHSAAESAGFATPTYQNSQFMAGSANSSDLISIPIPRLSPDGDAFEDFLQINYQTDRTDYTANIRIFDTEGRLIKSLVSNELLASQGQIIWEGDMDNGNKARIGIYLLFIELFTPDGDIRQFKETCVLAGQLK